MGNKKKKNNKQPKPKRQTRREANLQNPSASITKGIDGNDYTAYLKCFQSPDLYPILHLLRDAFEMGDPAGFTDTVRKVSDMPLVKTIAKEIRNIYDRDLLGKTADPITELQQSTRFTEKRITVRGCFNTRKIEKYFPRCPVFYIDTKVPATVKNKTKILEIRTKEIIEPLFLDHVKSAMKTQFFGFSIGVDYMTLQAKDLCKPTEGGFLVKYKGSWVREDPVLLNYPCRQKNNHVLLGYGDTISHGSISLKKTKGEKFVRLPPKIKPCTIADLKSSPSRITPKYDGYLNYLLVEDEEAYLLDSINTAYVHVYRYSGAAVGHADCAFEVEVVGDTVVPLRMLSWKGLCLPYNLDDLKMAFPTLNLKIQLPDACNNLLPQDGLIYHFSGWYRQAYVKQQMTYDLDYRSLIEMDKTNEYPQFQGIKEFVLEGSHLIFVRDRPAKTLPDDLDKINQLRKIDVYNRKSDLVESRLSTFLANIRQAPHPTTSHYRGINRYPGDNYALVVDMLEQEHIELAAWLVGQTIVADLTDGGQKRRVTFTDNTYLDGMKLPLTINPLTYQALSDTLGQYTSIPLFYSFWALHRDLMRKEPLYRRQITQNDRVGTLNTPDAFYHQQPISYKSNGAEGEFCLGKMPDRKKGDDTVPLGLFYLEDRGGQVPAFQNRKKTRFKLLWSGKDQDVQTDNQKLPIPDNYQLDQAFEPAYLEEETDYHEQEDDTGQWGTWADLESAYGS